MKPLWTFSALDTLFFKESRPIEAVGGSQLASVFPPPARTLIGAIRTSVGEAQGVNWQDYKKNADDPLRAVIGTPDSLGPLTFRGPYLIQKQARLFPVPLTFLKVDALQTRLIPDDKVTRCDLGAVLLPVKKNPDLAGASPLEDAYLNAQGLSDFLSGNDIQTKHIIQKSDLFTHEDRLGIGRDNSTRITSDGQLYQTRHIRPKQDAELQIGIAVHGLQEAGLPDQGMVRLGAEGRLAAWQRCASADLPVINRPKNATGLLLMLITPALFEKGWLPDGFMPEKEQGQDVWVGTIAGVRLKLMCSVVGKPQREGGWDLVNNAPRAMAAYAPAGSCYFCQLMDGADLQQAQQALHGQQMGAENEYGRGEIAVGFW